MKTTDKRNIMAMAWRFFRTTGQNFADCLRKAWQNFKLTAAMRVRIVRFHFQKIDGTIREAWGTLRTDLLPAAATDRKRNDTVQTYFDTERREYRSFKKLNLISII